MFTSPLDSIFPYPTGQDARFFKVTLSEFLDENIEVEFLLEKDCYINKEETHSNESDKQKSNQNNYEFSI